MKRFLTMCIAAVACAAWMVSPAAGESVADGYTVPTVTVPYAHEKPTIDGVIGDAEWVGAESTNALQTTRHQISPRQTRFWMTWDEENLYVAMRSPLRPGERPVRKIRDTNKDINVVFDDSYEVWLDVGSNSPDGQPVFFQFLSNFDAARYDVMHEPAVGNSRLGWTANWNPKNTINENNEWEMEMAIPRESVYLEKPFAEGFELTCLVARNFKNPWEQNSFEGTGSFAVRESHSRFVLAKDPPAVHLLRVADPEAKTIGLSLAVYGHKDEKLKWTFMSDGGAKLSETFDVKKGELTQAGPGLAVDQAGEGQFRVLITSADGKRTYLDYASLRQFGNLSTLKLPENARIKGDEVEMSLVFNPLNNYVRATGDFINFDARDRIDRCEFTVTDAAGKEIAKESFKLDELEYVRGVIEVGDVPFGEYKTTMHTISVDGDVMLRRESKFSKQDHNKFAWWNTKHGNAEAVVPPWTPVTVKGETLGVWGREMTVGTAGLPAKVTSQGRDLLAGPSTLVAQLPGGKTVEAKAKGVKVVSKKDWQVQADAAAELGDLDVSTRVTVEYDGMYKVEMTLTPAGEVTVDSLKAVIPLSDAVAEYVHACGEGIRYGFYYGFLPEEKAGRIWDCTAVDSQPMVVGSFIPYVWVGDSDGGLCFFADSDEGWFPNDDVPAIEMIRENGRVNLVLNLACSTSVIDKPRTIVFALQASPVKEMHDQWRMDSWWCGDTFKNYAYPDGKGSLIWQSLPFTTQPEACAKMVEGQHKGGNGYIFGFNKYRANAVPYFEYKTMGHVPAKGYFGEAWQAYPGQLWYGRTLTDFMIHSLGEWIEQCGIDGWYLDNVRPVHSDNIEAGRGYRLPDGRIQPTYMMFNMRTFFLRLRAVFAEHGKTGKIVNHMTNNMILPWNGAVDICYDGEHHVIYPEMGKDFMDFWSLGRLRVDYPGQWGSVVNFMHEYQGKWEPDALAKAMRAYTGAIVLHDALPSGNANGKNQALWIGRNRFGIEADDVTFLPHWEDAGLASGSKDVKLAGWLRPKKVLIAAVNFGEKTGAKIKLDVKKLKLAPAGQLKAWDAETEQPVDLQADGTLTVPVPRHDYRQIIVEPK